MWIRGYSASVKARVTRKTDLPKKDRQLNIRLTEAQYSAVERAAMRLGIDPSTWARMAVLRDTNYNPDDELA